MTNILLQNITVLIADDAPINLMIMTQVLTSAGATVITANNGMQALEKLEEQLVDIVLMDLQMPELNGFEAANVIRNCGQRYSNIPIIAVTAETAPNEIKKSIEAGMNDFITKPFVAQIICQKIISLLQPIAQEKNVVERVVDENLQNFDLTYLKDITDGQTDQMKLITDSLVLNGPLLIDESLKAVKLERWDDAFAHLHKLKGLIGLFYMDKIRVLLKLTEEDINEDAPNAIMISKKIEHIASQLNSNIALVVNEMSVC